MREELVEWRVERYMDEMDPFSTILWFVMQNNTVIAQCESEAHAHRILAEHQLHGAYEAVLEQIAAMSSASHDLEAAIAAARKALQLRD